MTCPVCSLPNPEGSRTCVRCGTALADTRTGFDAGGPQPPYPGPNQPGTSPPPAGYGRQDAYSAGHDQQATVQWGGQPGGYPPSTTPYPGQLGYGGYDPGGQAGAEPWGQSAFGQPGGHDQQATVQWGGQPGGYPPSTAPYPGQSGYGGYDPGGQAGAEPWGQSAFGQPGGYPPSTTPYPGQSGYGGYDPSGQAGPSPWDAPAPRTRTRPRVAAVVVAVVVVVLLVGGGLAGTVFRDDIFRKVFDAGAMNRDIATQYHDRYGKKITVHCPTGQRVTKGASFTCDIDGQDKTIQIKVTSDDGDYTWQLSS